MVNYDFKVLSDYEFEQLVRDVLSRHLDLDFQTFKRGKDDGIDLRYSSAENCTVIVQCKHYVGTGFNGLYSQIKNKELPKIEQLCPERYILVTSVDLSPSQQKKLHKLLLPYCQSLQDIYGQSRLNDLIRDYPEIETKTFKLWLTSEPVLQRVLKSRIFNQGDMELASIRDRLKYYVQTKGFSEAQKLLSKYRYCVLAGGPGIGKTTLAEMLLVHYIGEGYNPVVLSSSIDDAADVFSSNEKQIFYFDDFLGHALVELELTRNEDQRILRFLHTISKSPNKLLILTTREYVLNQAMLLSERLFQHNWARELLVLDLSTYSKLEQAQILYNHLYFSDIPDTHRQAILADQNYLKIINHPKFNPRIIQWMTTYFEFSETSSWNYVHSFLSNLNNPYKLWQHIYENSLKPSYRTLLLSLLTLPDHVLIEDLEKAYNKFHRTLAKHNGYPADSLDFKQAIKVLEGNFIVIEKQYDGALTVKFHNPSVSDVVYQYFCTDQELLDCFLKSIAFFGQTVRLQRYASRSKDNDSVLNDCMRRSAGLILEILERDLLKPDKEDVYPSLYSLYSMGKERKVQLADRIRFAVDFSKAHNLELHPIGRMLNILAKELIDGYSDKEAVQKLFARLVYHDLTVSSSSRVVAAAKELILDELETVEDFKVAATFCKLCDGLVSAAEVDGLRERFESHLSEAVDDLEESDDVDVLETFISNVQEIASQLGVNVRYELGVLEEKIEELQEAEDDDDENDSTSTFSPRNSSKNVNEDNDQSSEIDDLFASIDDDGG